MKSTIKIKLLCLLGATSLSLGVLLFTKPKKEIVRIEKQTQSLIDSIENGNEEIKFDQLISDIEVDYYEEADVEDVLFVPDLPTVSNDSLSTNQSRQSTNNTITGKGILEIDKINLKMPVSSGISNSALKVSACWLSQTANIGSTGNAVIAGHRNYTYGSHFNRLNELTSGDVITYKSADGEKMNFIVIETLEVLPDDIAAFEQPSDTSMLTLYTCTPIRSATHRLIVRATRV